MPKQLLLFTMDVGCISTLEAVVWKLVQAPALWLMAYIGSGITRMYTVVGVLHPALVWVAAGGSSAVARVTARHSTCMCMRTNRSASRGVVGCYCSPHTSYAQTGAA
jgi:hypothetical protein